MIENTPIADTLDRAFNGLELMLGVTSQEDTEKQKAEAKKTSKTSKTTKAKKKRLPDHQDTYYF